MLDVKQIIKDSVQVKSAMLDACTGDIQLAAQIMIDAAKASKKILWCGNGGSAADAQHMAAELMGGLVSHDRPAIASIALTTDSSFVTAWANDTGYESIFSRQIEGLGESGDVLIAISTSGNSENVIRGIDAAKAKSMIVIVLTGKSGGKMANLGDVTICIPSDDTQRIQEGHLLAEHILCESVEAAIMEN
ncbi:MAG: SIS domain-containing protein [Candidatus Marinimicrobia bacterium]|nr:SIS domain-containing protein [Candidatus Neomarinimicrobiota bacterium]MBL7009949.1 SIS domain-containing protein [Candidatus Neomarinimicrobiota bacterium]MBL7029752.1 SIS domain-containing protein [Candidatus Neomarinimicrobiota bacterium]